MSTKISKNDVEDIIALTPLQEGILFHYLSTTDHFVYQNHFILDFSGDLDQTVFRQAWEQAVADNEVLRTVFQWEKLQRPVQIILKRKELSFEYHDFSSNSPAVALDLFEQVMKAETNKKMDLQKQPFRILLCKVGNLQFKMAVSFHHILYDGWSNSILLNEFLENYKYIKAGKEIARHPKTKYKEYIKWRNKQDNEKGKAYWKEYLSHFYDKTQLLIPKNTESAGFESKPLEFSLPMQTLHQLQSFVKEHNLTIAVPIYLAWGILLQRYSDSEDVVFGTTVSGRVPEIAGMDQMVGLFINTVPLRVTGSAGDDLTSMLQQVNQALLSRKEYEYVSQVDIKAVSDINKRDQLFDSIVVIENYPLDKNRMESILDDVKVDSYSNVESTNFDLTLTVTLVEQITLNLQYNAEVYDETTIKLLVGHFIHILNDLITDPTKRLTEIEMMSEAEVQQILHDFNDTPFPYPDTTIHRWFEEQVERCPDQIAVIADDGTLTYKELNERANQLARVLVKHGSERNQAVAIMAERSLAMMIGLFAILKSGGAYQPINPKDPVSRIESVLEESGAKILLTQPHLVTPLNFAGSVLLIEEETGAEEERTNLPYTSTAEDLAYIIFTSGSTGKPKGVMVKHSAVVNGTHWVQRTYPLTDTDVILQKTPFTFDVSVWELFGWFYHGAKLCMLTPGGEKDPEAIAQAVAQHQITVLHMVPSVLNMFLTYMEANPQGDRLRSLRLVFACGEALTSWHVENFYQQMKQHAGIQLVNLYGPTEATVAVSSYECPKDAAVPLVVPIGKPFDNIQLYVLNKRNQLQPVGLLGELYIAGDGVAKGYINRPELTEERFVPDPFRQEGNMYKTGDLARWLPDGNIEYLGRADFQVKIRGNRVELGEIESKLQQLPEVNDAVVLAKESKNGEKYLSAYIASDAQPDLEALKKYLASQVPEYMIPAKFTVLDQLPLTPTGKVNRTALIEIKEDDLNLRAEYAPAANELQQQLIEIWEKLLDTKVGIHDHFFDIGGNSVLLIQLQAQIEKIMPGKVKVTDLFALPTISSLAKFIEQKEEMHKRVELTGIPFPEEYFVTNHSNSEHKLFSVTLTQEWIDKLQRVARNTETKLTDLFLALFGYVLHRSSQTADITVQMMQDNQQRIAPVRIDFTQMQDFQQLFGAINREQASIQPQDTYRLAAVGSSVTRRQEHEHEIIPFIYQGGSLDNPQEILHVYDLVLCVEERSNGYAFHCEYNRTKLHPDKMEGLLQNFVNMLEVVAEKM
ncbi:non-ribosomal peptide synthetase [Brevibacillus dissolubilis]|uniref:non-ribosomal peptide synthetase n=1 Tax=Brevibacillus dissolubilis TaxID=1844116 RepID=UPI0011175111|nr:non-ribosomal peptide synthetase [Brevibacillus dissolubilis]